MIDLLEEHLARLRSQISSPRAALAALAPHLRPDLPPDGPDPALSEALLALPARIPAFLRGLEAIMRQTADDRVRAFAGGIFAYVFNPIDILSAEELGYLGYVEDAVICWRGLELLRDEFGVTPEGTSGIERADADRVESVWSALRDDVQDAVDAFLEQFEAILKGLVF